MEVEMNKYLELLVLMGQVWIDSTKNYWLIGPSIRRQTYISTNHE
jgi:hypothetical protein